MGAADARRDRIVALGDLTFIHLDANEGIGIRDPDFLEAELDSRTAEITLVGGYRVVNDGPVKVDLLAGGRMNFFKTTLQLDGPNRSLDGSKKEQWLDPLIAARIQAPLGGKWGFAAYGDLGGIIFGSDVTWQLAPGVTYQINHKMSVGLGWRYYKVNYDHGDFLYNIHQSGPLITFRTAI
jgi:opacity protein-like surface antigen